MITVKVFIYELFHNKRYRIYDPQSKLVSTTNLVDSPAIADAYEHLQHQNDLQMRWLATGYLTYRTERRSTNTPT